MACRYKWPVSLVPSYSSNSIAKILNLASRIALCECICFCMATARPWIVLIHFHQIELIRRYPPCHLQCNLVEFLLACIHFFVVVLFLIWIACTLFENSPEEAFANATGNCSALNSFINKGLRYEFSSWIESIRKQVLFSGNMQSFPLVFFCFRSFCFVF